jgi:hypothetical protein
MFSALIFSSCGEKKVSFDEQASGSGLMPEQFIPSDIGMIFSYSLLNDEQFAATEKILEKIGNPEKASETISESFAKQFDGAEIDYQTDLEPAFGEQYRVVFAAKSGPETASGSTTLAYSVIALQDSAALEVALKKLESDGKLSSEDVGGEDVFKSKDSAFYATLHEDLFFVSDSPESILGMIKMKEAESLWASDTYQNDIEKIGGDHVFYALIYPQLFNQMQSQIATAGLGVQGMAAILLNEGVVVRAESDGFRFDGFATGDEKKAKELGTNVSFDSVPKTEAYLYKEIPSSGLMLYIESNGIKQTLEFAEELNSEDYDLESLGTSVKNYFGMDLKEEILSFLDKGYALALYQNNESIIPDGVIYFDVSSDEENAQKFIDKVDAQLSGLLVIVEQAIPGAVSKGTTEIEGVEISSLEIDLSTLPNVTGSTLPAAVTGSSIKLSYGIIGDRLLISTSSSWEEEDFTPISKSGLYKQLSSKLEDVDEGLILIDAEAIGNFLKSLKALRDELGLDVADFSFEKLLDGFVGGIAAGKSEAYESKLGGFIKIKE